MATISSLPVELLFAIGEYFDPGDCFDFALTCKNNWVAFKSTVERHQQLHGEYRHVVTKREERTIWNLLNTSLARPDVAYHIKQLTLTHDRDYGYLSGRSHSPWKPQGGVPGKDITRYIKVASENSFLTAAPHDPEFESLRRRFRKEVDVYQIIRNGADGPLIPVLLFLLPRLRELRYCDGGDDHWLLHSLRHLADAYDRLGTTSNVSLPLGCLTTAYISHDEDSRQRIDWAFVHCIIRIPTLRSFTGHMVGGDLHPLEETLFEGRPLRSDAPTSNVEELVFSYSGIGPNAFEAILSLTKNLKRFHYQHSNYIHDPPYDAWRIVAALRQYCGNSLERLELAAVDSVCVRSR
ncbi:hypothetical protein BDV95DRAFT_118605 [Massariosphaeria phaeospora]|uniref:F-box domain-containing protein n=1 Tax=Massariosphaeria phaeospora TaxID=100035 RepID=A0A7C8I1W8_9PLEO|nr:hypothetical protein BDV95DRAFT_118605 [Massariosphaeria phaeospora]